MSRGKGSRKRRGLRARLSMKVEQKTVAILIPATDECKTGFAMSLAHMIKKTLIERPDNLGGISVQSYGTSILPFSRQVLAQTAIDQGASHMLWLDSDMEFPDDMLMRFMRHDEAIVGINAMNRRKPFRCTAQTGPGTALVTNMESSGLEKVHRMGFGVVWIRTEVFTQIEKPWFTFDYVPELGVFRGEDYSFFEKAKALGYECYVDHDISKQVYHVGSFGFNPLMLSVVDGQSAPISAPEAPESAPEEV